VQRDLSAFRCTNPLIALQFPGHPGKLVILVEVDELHRGIEGRWPRGGIPIGCECDATRTKTLVSSQASRVAGSSRAYSVRRRPKNGSAGPSTALSR
jgi:hypothetical protein